MGSQSDWETMRHAADTARPVGNRAMRRGSSRRIARPSGCMIMPATARSRGLRLIIAGRRRGAHLPGMAAALTPLPVLGVPIESQAAERDRQPPFDRPDARRGSGCDLRHRPGRAPSTRRCLRRRSSAFPIAAPREASTTGARPRPSGSANAPPAGNVSPGRHDRHIGGWPARPDDRARRRRLGYRCHVFANEPDSPAEQVCGRGDDRRLHRWRGARTFCRRDRCCDLSNSKMFRPRSVRWFSARKPVLPQPEILEIAQDRLREKDFLRSIGVGPPRYREISDAVRAGPCDARLRLSGGAENRAHGV